MAEAYPARALAMGREGEAIVHCTVRNSGKLNCVPTSQSDAGFAEAALRVARMFRQTPKDDQDVAVATPVDLHIVFRLPDDIRRS